VRRMHQVSLVRVANQRRRVSVESDHVIFFSVGSYDFFTEAPILFLKLQWGPGTPKLLCSFAAASNRLILIFINNLSGES
jgi:hypothetical protein